MTTATATSMKRRVVTTAELQQLLAEGKKVMLPPVTVPKAQQEGLDTALLSTAEQYREVSSVEKTSRELVQCIAVDDPRHLYVTDGLVATHNTSNIISSEEHASELQSRFDLVCRLLLEKKN